MLVILALGAVVSKEIHYIFRLDPQAAGHGGVVIALHSHREGGDGKEDHKKHHAQRVGHPPAADALPGTPFLLFHGCPPPLLSRSQGIFTRPTYSQSPKLW